MFKFYISDYFYALTNDVGSDKRVGTWGLYYIEWCVGILYW
jgi:hypothetical protein